MSKRLKHESRIALADATGRARKAELAARQQAEAKREAERLMRCAMHANPGLERFLALHA